MYRHLGGESKKYVFFFATKIKEQTSCFSRRTRFTLSIIFLMPSLSLNFYNNSAVAWVKQKVYCSAENTNRRLFTRKV